MSATSSTRPGNYSIARATEQCSVCSAKMQSGDVCYAALRDSQPQDNTPDNPLHRVDICATCWETYDRASLIAYWRGSVQQHAEKKRLFVDDSVLCELFQRLGDSTEPSRINFRFVLGLILMRKRLVIYDSTTTRDGGDYWTVRLKGREERMEMLDPHLTEAQVAEVSTQLGDILTGEL